MPKIGPLELLIVAIPCVMLPLCIIGVVAIIRMVWKSKSPKDTTAQDEKPS